MRLTNSQLMEMLQQAHQQFLAAVAAVPEALIYATPLAGSWSIMDVLFHMCTAAVSDLSSLTSVLVRGERPADVRDVLIPASLELTRSTLLADLEDARTRLIALVQHG